ncbi:hypothetical protein ABTJ88_19635, partial [Acinetobacter baumannii]
SGVLTALAGDLPGVSIRRRWQRVQAPLFRRFRDGGVAVEIAVHLRVGVTHKAQSLRDLSTGSRAQLRLC